MKLRPKSKRYVPIPKRHVWAVVSVTGFLALDDAKWGKTLLFFPSKSAARAALWGDQERIAKIAITEVQE